MRQFLTGLAVTLLSIAPVAPARAETLADALVSAYEHSGLLEQNRALLRAADEDVAQIVASLRPIINWSADITRTFGKSRTSGANRPFRSNDANIGVTLNLLLFDFGRSQFRLDAAKESVLATREGLVSTEQQVLFRAVQAYMNVRRTTQFVTLGENNVRLLSQELRAAKDRFEVGEVTRTDVALAESRRAAAQSNLARAQGDLMQAIEEFRSAMGRKPGNLQPPGRLPNLSGDVEGSKMIAMRAHPDMLKVQHEVAAADLIILAAGAAMKPSLNLTSRLGGGEEINGSDFTRSGSIGLELSGPIYQGGLLSSAKRQAMAQRDAIRGALHTIRYSVAQDVGTAYAIMRAAQAGVTATKERVRAARVAFLGVREEAKLGARTTLDVLDAEQELLEAEATLISDNVDVYIAAYGVLSSIGQLTAKDLKLNVQTYDPAAYYNLVKTAPVGISPQGKKLDKILRALGKE